MDQKNWLAKSFSLSEQPYRSVRTSLVAGLFVCGKSVLAETAGFRVVVGADPYGFVQKFLLAGIICQSLKFLLSHFDTSATKLRIKLKGGRVG